jgi:hypothetical protein
MDSLLSHFGLEGLEIYSVLKSKRKWWFTPVILFTWEAEIRRTAV